MSITAIYADSTVARSSDASSFVPESKPQEKSFGEYITKAENTGRSEQNTAPQNKPQPQEVKSVARQETKQGVKGKSAAEGGNIEPKQEQGVAANPLQETAQAADAPQTTMNESTAAAAVSVITSQTMTETAEEAVINLTPAVNDAIIGQIAEKLGIAREDAEGILNKLSLAPQDLMDKDNLRAFVREFYGVATNADLLNIPDVKQTITAIEEVVTNAVKEFKAQEMNNTAQNMFNAQTTQVESPLTASVAAAQTAAEQQITTAEAEVISNALTQEVSKTTPSDTKDNASAGNQNNTENLFNQASAGSEIKTASSAADELKSQEQAANVSEAAKTTLKAEAALKTARSTSSQEVIKQVTEHIKTEIKTGVSEVRILLKPESLGEITLKVAIERGIVTAQFVAESQRIKGIIESNMSELKEALADSGVSVGTLSVSVSQGESESMRAFERERRLSAKRISKLIGDAGEQEEQEASVVTEDEVMESQVSFTA